MSIRMSVYMLVQTSARMSLHMSTLQATGTPVAPKPKPCPQHPKPCADDDDAHHKRDDDDDDAHHKRDDDDDDAHPTSASFNERVAELFGRFDNDADNTLDCAEMGTKELWPTIVMT